MKNHCIFARCAPRSTYLSIIQIGKVEDGGPTLLEFNPKFWPIKNENKDKNFSEEAYNMSPLYVTSVFEPCVNDVKV